MKKLKVIINAYQYAPSITGTDRLAFNYLAQLQELDKTNKYFIICSNEAYVASAIKPGNNFRVIRPTYKGSNPLIRRVGNKLWRELLPYSLWFLRAHSYYSVHNMQLPPFRVAKRMIASNLDIIPLRVEGYAGLGRLNPQKEKAQYERVAREADYFVSISEFSKNELAKYLSVSKSRIQVIPLAADPSLIAHENTAIKLPSKFIFTLGGSEPRKNVAMIVEAYSKLPDSTQKRYPLLIVGGAWNGVSLDALKQNSNVTVLGYVSDEALAVMYKKASAFVFASTYEGFGFTILEAMAAGTPVLSSSSSSLPEVAGSATLLFDPANLSDLSKKLSRLLDDTKLQKELAAKGLARSKEFSWEVSASKLHHLLTNQ